MSILLLTGLSFTLATLAKSLLLALIAVLNGVLAFLAVVATWKTALAIGVKVALIILFCIPILGILAFLFWGQKVVRNNQAF